MIVLKLCVILIDQAVVGTDGTTMYTRDNLRGTGKLLPSALGTERWLPGRGGIRRTTTTHWVVKTFHVVRRGRFGVG